MITVLNGILVEEASRLDGDLYERSIHTSPWIDLVDTGAFPDGMGDVISTMIWERSLPTGSVTWQNTMGVDGGNDSIVPSALTVSTAKTLREYRLQHCALESDELNVNDLRTAVIRDEQLSAMRDNLSMNTNYLWRSRARSEYDRLVTHLTLVAAGNIESVSGGAADSTISDTLLSNASMTRYRNRMIRMGAARRPLDRIDGAPVFGLILDSEVSDALKAETSITEAMKFSGRASELLSPLGVERAYKNFFHIIDDLAPRFTYTATQTVQGVTLTAAGSGYVSTPLVTFSGAGTGATGYAIMQNGAVSSVVITNPGSGYSAATVAFTASPGVTATGTVNLGGSFVEVVPYSNASATFGTKLIENPAYETAPYTRTYIYQQDVMKLLYPNTVTSASGTSFDPVMYRGEWKWLNIASLIPGAQYNPDGTKGRFRGVFAAATKPGVTEYGFAITHKRPGF